MLGCRNLGATGRAPRPEHKLCPCCVPVRGHLWGALRGVPVCGVWVFLSPASPGSGLKTRDGRCIPPHTGCASCCGPPHPVSWAVRPVCVVSPCPCSVTCKVSRPFWASGLWVLDVPRTAGGFSGFGVLGKLKARGMLWKFNLRGAGAPKVQDWAWPQKVDPQSSCMGWRRGRDQSLVFSGSMGSADTLIGAHWRPGPGSP